MCGQVLGCDITSVQSPQLVIRRAPQLGAVAERQPNDWSNPRLLHAQRSACEDTLPLVSWARAVLARGCTMRVDVDRLTFAKALVQLGDGQESLAGVHPRLARKARVRGVDAARARARVPAVD